MAPIKRVVLDLLKPHEPPMAEFAREVASLDGVSAVNATLLETDQEVQNVKLTIEGEALDDGAIDRTIDHLSGTVHSVDQVVCGDHIVEDVETPQD